MNLYPQIKLYKENDELEKEYVIDDTNDTYGVTAIGYYFTPVGCNKQIFVHPSQYKRIEIVF